MPTVAGIITPDEGGVLGIEGAEIGNPLGGAIGPPLDVIAGGSGGTKFCIPGFSGSGERIGAPVPSFAIRRLGSAVEAGGRGAGNAAGFVRAAVGPNGENDALSAGI